jgi:hypothetical protein
MSLNPVKHTSANSQALVAAKIINHREKRKGSEERKNRSKKKWQESLINNHWNFIIICQLHISVHQTITSQTSLLLKVGTTRCPKKSVTNAKCALDKFPEDRGPQMLFVLEHLWATNMGRAIC